MKSPFTNIEITRHINKGSLLAAGKMLVAGTAEVHFTIVNGKNGTFVSLPSKPFQDTEGNTKYQNLVKIPDEATYKMMQKDVIKVYSEESGADQGSPEATEDSIPF